MISESKCDYLTIILDSHWGCDIFEHPKYRYYCKKRGIMLKVPSIYCRKCKYKKCNEVLEDE